MESGTLDANLRLDPAASKLNQLVIAHDGTAMDRRQPQDIHVPLYNNAIGPGAARVVHYRFKVPADAKGSVTLSAAATTASSRATIRSSSTARTRSRFRSRASRRTP